jgi:hypothetical protein
MSRATSEMRSIAKGLMALETPRSRSSAAKSPAGFRVVEKLRPHLANLMGNGGYRALLARALALAGAEVSWLGAVRVKTDGNFEGLEEARARLDPAEFLEGGTVLMAQLLGLLVALVGPSLTSRLLGEVWPKFEPTMWNSTGGEVQDEKAK